MSILNIIKRFNKRKSLDENTLQFIVNRTHVKTINKNLKILCIADTHGTLKECQAELLKDVEYDVCFLLGDVTHKDLQILDSYLDKSKTYGVLGNHDDFGLLEKMGIKNIHMKQIEISGVTFFGFEGSFRYKD